MEKVNHARTEEEVVETSESRGEKEKAGSGFKKKFVIGFGGGTREAEGEAHNIQARRGKDVFVTPRITKKKRGNRHTIRRYWQEWVTIKPTYVWGKKKKKKSFSPQRAANDPTKVGREESIRRIKTHTTVKNTKIFGSGPWRKKNPTGTGRKGTDHQFLI